MKPKLSIILPTYNRPEFYEKRLIELAKIDFPFPTEIFTVYDGCYYQLEGLKIPQKNLEFRGFRLQNNSGCVSIPRNLGIIYSSGEYIMHQDDDCIMLKEKLELIDLLDKNPEMLLAYGNRYDLHTTVPGMFLSEYIANPKYNPFTGTGIDGSQIVYRRSVYDHIPLHFARRACDWNLMKYIWEHKPNSFIHLNKIVSIYLWHQKNRSLDNSTKIKQINIDKDCFNRINEHRDNKYKFNFEIINAD